MIIDIFTHHISKSVEPLIAKAGYYVAPDEPGFDMWKSKGQFFYEGANAVAEKRLAIMDRQGVDLHVLSQTTPVLLNSNPEQAQEICRLSNTDNYKLCKLYPKRFMNVAIFSLLDVKASLVELERNMNELDCRGVTLATNQDGKGLDSPEFFPFYEKLVEYDLPIWLQPINWSGYPLVQNDLGFNAMSQFGWPFDTTQAMWHLIFGGVLDRFPSLKIITHHCGAMFPFFGERFARYGNAMLKRPFSEYCKNFYGDTALAGSVPACNCGYDFFGPDRMMYGSDYPFGGEPGIKFSLESVRAMKASKSDIKKILGESARALLKIK
jgi:uncharacterized protein